MNTQLDCIPCFIHQALKAIRLAGGDVAANQGLPGTRLRVVAAVATVIIACSVVAGFWWSSVRSIERTGTPQLETTRQGSDGAGLLGSMSLTQAAAALGCSVNEVKQRLGLPVGVHTGEHLGQIAKARGITLREMRKRLEPQNPEPKP